MLLSVSPSLLLLLLFLHRFPEAGEEATLAPILRVLNDIMSQKGVVAPDSVLHTAAAALDAGLGVLFPSASERRELLTQLVSAVRQMAGGGCWGLCEAAPSHTLLCLLRTGRCH